MEMTKRAIAKALGLKTDAAIGRYFGISRSAVTQWGDDQPIPEVRRLQLQVNAPEVVARIQFDNNNGRRRNRKQAVEVERAQVGNNNSRE